MLQLISMFLYSMQEKKVRRRKRAMPRKIRSMLDSHKNWNGGSNTIKSLKGSAKTKQI